MHLINLAMWPPVAPLAQDILTTLGDSAATRERFLLYHADGGMDE